jgi:hypothetical protein
MVLRGCEGPRSDAKVASDPGAPSHFLRALSNGQDSFLTLVDSVPCPVSGAIAEQQGEACRMTALLIEIASWFGTFGFIAAIIADTFR